MSAGEARCGVRVGTGVDFHAFGPGGALVLGGVTIPHPRGVVAHSDGDVLLHALVDAMLGAVALGDIGEHFPDTDPQWRGAASARFVAAALELLARRGWSVGNVDLTLIAQQPRIAPWREPVRQSVARMLGLAADAVNLKATTTEHLGFLGRGEGIGAMATVLVFRADA
jgi:2-C-methyl-D-erythritol 2,4-cyclodiphosphate synthase